MRGHFDCLTPSSLGLAPAPALTPSRRTGFFYLCNSKITNSVAAPASRYGGAGTALAAMSHSSTPLSSLLLTSGSFSGKYSSSLSLTVISVCVPSLSEPSNSVPTPLSESQAGDAIGDIASSSNASVTSTERQLRGAGKAAAQGCMA